MTLKILLPVYEASTHSFFSDRILNQIRKAGMPYDLLTLTNRDHRIGELPARNALFRMALLDKEAYYFVTLSNDLVELPKDWAKTLVEQMNELSTDVGALNAFGFIDTFSGHEWAQNVIDADGNNTGAILPLIVPLEEQDVFSKITPPNPELSTACCIMRRDVLEEVGLFDEGFGMGGGMEHWDYVIRMYQHGFENLLTYKVRFKTNIRAGNNFAQNDTHTYYRKKYGTSFDGIPVREFVEKAKAWPI